jgi:hypothetical protein
MTTTAIFFWLEMNKTENDVKLRLDNPHPSNFIFGKFGEQFFVSEAKA